jgi:hypothetical protein
MVRIASSSFSRLSWSRVFSAMVASGACSAASPGSTTSSDSTSGTVDAGTDSVAAAGTPALLGSLFGAGLVSSLNRSGWGGTKPAGRCERMGTTHVDLVTVLDKLQHISKRRYQTVDSGIPCPGRRPPGFPVAIEAAGLRDHLLTVNGQRSSCVDHDRDQAAIGGKLRVIFSFV